MGDPEETLRDAGAGGGAAFSTTHWTMVLTARDAADGDASSALESLCRAYWYPLYVYARRWGRSAEDAQDLTQDFFQNLLSKEGLATVDREKGRFRSFLLASMKNLLIKDHRKANAQKRGGGAQIFSVDEQDAEGRYTCEPASEELSPEDAYERTWAESLVDRSIERIRDEWETKKSGQSFDDVKVFLLGRKREGEFGAVAERLSMSEGAFRVAIHRLRKRYGEIFREEVAHTVSDEAEIDDEIRHLLAMLG